MRRRDLWSWATDKIFIGAMVPVGITWVEREVVATSPPDVLSPGLGFLIAGVVCVQSALPWLDPWKSRRYAAAPPTTRLASTVAMVASTVAFVLWVVTLDGADSRGSAPAALVMVAAAVGVSFVLSPPDPGDVVS